MASSDAQPQPVAAASDAPLASARHQKIITFALLGLVMAIDDADQNLLPAVYLEVCQEFDVGPSILGFTTMWRGLVQSLVAVVAGPLGSRYDRIHLIALGCCLWGIASAFVGASSSMTMLLFVRACNGIGIGLVIPLSFAVVADLAPDSMRGRAFGVLNFASNFGRAAGGFFATSLAATPAVSILGDAHATVSGWRLVFYLISIASCVAAALLACFGREPRLPALSTSAGAQRPAPLSVSSAVADALAVLRIPSFLIILLQGALGTAPWYSMGFLVIYFEVRGATAKDRTRSGSLACETACMPANMSAR